MGAKDVLAVSTLDDFFTLNRIYKWIVYFLGWLVIISSFIFIVLIIVLYFFRDKTIKKKHKDYLQFGYQRLPYLVGWACFLIVVSLILTAGAFWLGRSLSVLVL